MKAVRREPRDGANLKSKTKVDALAVKRVRGGVKTGIRGGFVIAGKNDQSGE